MLGVGRPASPAPAWPDPLALIRRKPSSFTEVGMNSAQRVLTATISVWTRALRPDRWAWPGLRRRRLPLMTALGERLETVPRRSDRGRPPEFTVERPDSNERRRCSNRRSILAASEFKARPRAAPGAGRRHRCAGLGGSSLALCRCAAETRTAPPGCGDHLGGVVTVLVPPLRQSRGRSPGPCVGGVGRSGRGVAGDHGLDSRSAVPEPVTAALASLGVCRDLQARASP